MSIWKEAKDEDVGIDFNQETIDINYGQDHNGNLYISLSFKQIKDLYDEITKQAYECKDHGWSETKKCHKCTEVEND